MKTLTLLITLLFFGGCGSIAVIDKDTGICIYDKHEYLDIVEKLSNDQRIETIIWYLQAKSYKAKYWYKIYIEFIQSEVLPLYMKNDIESGLINKGKDLKLKYNKNSLWQHADKRILKEICYLTSVSY